MPLEPFADEAATLLVGELEVENRLDRVTLQGGVDLTRDRAGLRRTRELLALLRRVERALLREGEALPEAIETRPEERVRNPFS